MGDMVLKILKKLLDKAYKREYNVAATNDCKGFPAEIMARAAGINYARRFEDSNFSCMILTEFEAIF